MKRAGWPRMSPPAGLSRCRNCRISFGSWRRRTRRGPEACLSISGRRASSCRRIRPLDATATAGVWVHGHVIRAGSLRIFEQNIDVVADALDEPVEPCLIRVGLGGIALGMAVEFVGRAEHDVDAAAVGFPAGHCCVCEMLVGICDAAVVLFHEFVSRRAGGGVAALPELLYELPPLLVSLQALEGCALLVGDDVGYILIHPFGIGRLDLPGDQH